MTRYVELTERSAIANRNGASVFVSIHLNADATSADTAGVETYFCSRKRLGDLVKAAGPFRDCPRACLQGRPQRVAGAHGAAGGVRRHRGL